MEQKFHKDRPNANGKAIIRCHCSSRVHENRPSRPSEPLRPLSNAHASRMSFSLLPAASATVRLVSILYSSK